MCIGFMHGSVWLRLQKLDHPTTLGIGGIGCAIASEGVHNVKPCSGRLLVGVPQVAAWVMTHGPAAPPLKWWGGRWERAHASTCKRPGRLTILECHFNKTMHHPFFGPMGRASGMGAFFLIGGGRT